ncbi:Ribosomal silencing factor RsfS [Legionella adelaidensis]|uniref:Ribosomal silencing factor RsfS n=1 Tax=Legionella adelaidensis TaxID=45056 RepID=A0A0W0R4S2_9GAMM|nr:ribosome silencing factor [Legionella adelaidensis]KTC66041.1 Ribosomal silencing factor RsfS [Legionella adelaidensis]
MSEKNLLDKLHQYLDDAHAQDITLIDVRNQTSVTDYMIICSGRSSRHVKAIAEQIMEQMKAQGLPALGSTGLDSGDWALIDFGDIVIHVMQPDSRAFYNLEGLWQEKPQ